MCSRYAYFSMEGSGNMAVFRGLSVSAWCVCSCRLMWLYTPTVHTKSWLFCTRKTKQKALFAPTVVVHFSSVALVRRPAGSTLHRALCSPNWNYSSVATHVWLPRYGSVSTLIQLVFCRNSMHKPTWCKLSMTEVSLTMFLLNCWGLGVIVGGKSHFKEHRFQKSSW